MPAAPRPTVTTRRQYSPGRLIRANLYDLLRLLHESRVALLGFALVMIMGTAYIRLRYALGYAESLYESFRLLTLQSGLQFPRESLGQVLFFLVPVLGLALILDSVFRFGRLVLDKSSRREAWQVALASTYQRHVIVCGLGRVGLRVVTQLLATGYEVVIVERSWDGEFVPRALDLRVPVVQGDARTIATLHAAGLLRVHALIVCINDDLVNIEVALLVRRERPTIRVIQRVFNDDLDRNLEGTFGRNTVFSASALAAPTFAAAAVSREFKYVLPIGDQALGVTEMTIAQESLMSGFVRRLEEDVGMRVLSHVNAAGRPLASVAMRQFDTGDQVVLIGPLAALEALRVKNVPRSKAHAALGMLDRQRPTAEYNRVIVCGLGKVGYRMVLQLHRMSPRPTIVVVTDAATRPVFLYEIAQLDGVLRVEGDARSADVLREAGLHEAYSVAAMTSDDLVNMQIGLTARRLRSDIHLVMRLFSDVLAEQLEELFAIRTVYSTSALAAPTMAAAAVLGAVSHAFFSNATLYSAEMLSVRAGDGFAGRSVEQIREQQHVVVIAIQQHGTTNVLPSYASIIQVGDELMLLARLQTLARIRVANGESVPTPAPHKPIRAR